MHNNISELPLTSDTSSLAPAKKNRARLKERFLALIKHPSTAIFIITFLFYTLVGCYGVLIYNFSDTDGLARISQAFTAIFGRDPHLSAIGFIWPPLPAVSDIPFVVLLEPFQLEILAGTLMSATYAGFAMVQLNNILKRFNVETGWRYVWMILLGIQPLVLHNATLGLSETPFIGFLLLSFNGYLIWRQDGKERGLMLAGIGACLALYCRYEALAFIAITAVSICWNWIFKGGKISPDKLEAELLAYLVPPAYGFVYWIFLNWTIMDNPIYFLVGPEATANVPDTAKVYGPDHVWYYAMDSISGSIKLLFEEIEFVGPLLLVATIFLLLIIFIKKNWIDFDYIMFGWSVVAFTVLSGYQGYLPPFSRYFIWLIPGSLIVMGVVYSSLKSKILRLIANFLLIGLLIYPIINQIKEKWDFFDNPMPQKILLTWIIAGEQQSVTYENSLIDEMQMIADYLNAQLEGTTTIIDQSISGSLGFIVDHPENLIMTSDTDFFDILRDPVGKADQILVPYPSFDARGRSQVLTYYPGIYEGFETWTTFLYEFPSSSPWRLYLINDDANTGD